MLACARWGWGRHILASAQTLLVCPGLVSSWCCQGQQSWQGHLPVPPLSNSPEQRIFALASASLDAKEPPRLARVAMGVRGLPAPPTTCAPVAQPSLPDNTRLCRGSPFWLLEPLLHIPRLLPSSWKLSGGMCAHPGEVAFVVAVARSTPSGPHTLSKFPGSRGSVLCNLQRP